MKVFFSLIAVLLISNFCFSQSEGSKSVDKVNKQSVIVFKNTVYDYGKIKQNEDGTAIFEFKNMSKDDVEIINVKTSCGCTGADWPKEPIKKNKKGTINVMYDTENEIGKFHETIYVYLNKLENPLKLEIKGEILPFSNN